MTKLARAVAWKRGKEILLAAVLFLTLSNLRNTNAQALTIDNSQPVVVIVGVNSQAPSEIRTTSDMLIAEVVASKKSTSKIASLGNPIDAAFTFGTLEYSANIVIPADSAIHVMRRYVSLAYDGSKSAKAAETLLKGDQRFAYVGLESEGGFSAPLVPTDEFFSRPPGANDPSETGFQWGMNLLNTPGAYGFTSGWGRVGMLEGGADANVPDLAGRFSYFGSIDFISRTQASTRTGFRDITYRLDSGYHGTHSDGIALGSANNPRPGQTFGQGISGACQSCVLQHVTSASLDSRLLGARWLSEWGAQVVNLSGFISDVGQPTQSLPLHSNCPAYGYSEQSHPFCAVLQLMRQRDILFVASSGNNKSFIQFPARDPFAVAVGGIDVLGRLWDEALWPEADDNPNGCPSPWNQNNPNGVAECGSNSGPEQDFVAPSRNIVSTVRPGTVFGGVERFSDAAFLPAGAGYGYLTGTSMAAPHVAGIMGLVRSLHPIATGDDVIQLLQSTASNGGQHNGSTGWGVPNAGLVTEQALGKSHGTQMTNRLTPLFVLHNTLDADRLYTTNPSLATGAEFGNYMVTPDCSYVATIPVCVTGAQFGNEPRPYVSPDWTEVPVNSAYVEAIPISMQSIIWPDWGYHYPGLPISGAAHIPLAAFYVFTSGKPVFPGTTMRPLYKLVFDHDCDRRDHVYATTVTDVNYFTTTDFCPPPGNGTNEVNAYRLDGIEGYVLSGCPTGAPYSGCKAVLAPHRKHMPDEFAAVADYSIPQALYRRFNPLFDEGYILLLESQLRLPEFARFTGSVNGAGPIGYVFVNLDTDGDELIDGQERLLQTSVFSRDSDCDGVFDNDEYPAFHFQPLGSDPRLPDQCTDKVSISGTSQVLAQNLAARTKTTRYTFNVTNFTNDTISVPVTFMWNWWPSNIVLRNAGNCILSYTYEFRCEALGAFQTSQVVIDVSFDNYYLSDLTGIDWLKVRAKALQMDQGPLLFDSKPDNNVFYFRP